MLFMMTFSGSFKSGLWIETTVIFRQKYFIILEENQITNFVKLMS